MTPKKRIPTGFALLLELTENLLELTENKVHVSVDKTYIAKLIEGNIISLLNSQRTGFKINIPSQKNWLANHVHVHSLFLTQISY